MFCIVKTLYLASYGWNAECAKIFQMTFHISMDIDGMSKQTLETYTQQQKKGNYIDSCVVMPCLNIKHVCYIFIFVYIAVAYERTNVPTTNRLKISQWSHTGVSIYRTRTDWEKKTQKHDRIPKNIQILS